MADTPAPPHSPLPNQQGLLLAWAATWFPTSCLSPLNVMGRFGGSFPTCPTGPRWYLGWWGLGCVWHTPESSRIHAAWGQLYRRRQREAGREIASHPPPPPSFLWCHGSQWPRVKAILVTAFDLFPLSFIHSASPFIHRMSFASGLCFPGKSARIIAANQPGYHFGSVVGFPSQGKLA